MMPSTQVRHDYVLNQAFEQDCHQVGTYAGIPDASLQEDSTASFSFLNIVFCKMQDLRPTMASDLLYTCQGQERRACASNGLDVP